MGEDYQVYILENETGKYYIGYTEDVDHRLNQHNEGVSKWTAKYRPWKLVWRSKVMSRKEAFALERMLKRSKGGNRFYELTGIARKREGS